MTLPITGGCFCGAVRFECTAEPIFMLRCHCRDCQQVSGGPYAPAVIFPYSAFRLSKGELRRYATGHNLRGFCAECGSRLTGAESPERGIMGVTASALDDPGIFQPSCDVYAEDAQAWDVPDPSVKIYPGPMPRSS